MRPAASICGALLLVLLVSYWLLRGERLQSVGPYRSTHPTPELESAIALDASDALVVLSRAAVPPSPGNHAPGVLAEADQGWIDIARQTESAVGSLVSMRSAREVAYRSEFFNPEDIYIEASTRAAFSAAYRDALKRLRGLEDQRIKIAIQEIQALDAAGRFELADDGHTHVLRRKASNPGEGGEPYTYVDVAGREFHLSFSDLTWTREVESLAQFISEQVDVSVVDFFHSIGTLDTARRDLLLTYGIGREAQQRFKQLEQVSRPEYLRVRRVLFGW